jgi:hypothetical protein
MPLGVQVPAAKTNSQRGLRFHFLSSFIYLIYFFCPFCIPFTFSPQNTTTLALNASILH